MPRLAEAIDQVLVAGLEEDHLEEGPIPVERRRGPLDRRRRITGANVEHEGGPAISVAVLASEGQEVLEQRRRQVVDDGVAQVLEDLAGLALAGAGEAADHEQVVELGVGAQRGRVPVAARPRIGRGLGGRGARHDPLHARTRFEYSRAHARSRPSRRPRTVAATEPRSASRSYPPSSVSATPGSPSRDAVEPRSRATASNPASVTASSASGSAACASYPAETRIASGPNASIAGSSSSRQAATKASSPSPA